MSLVIGEVFCQKKAMLDTMRSLAYFHALKAIQFYFDVHVYILLLKKRNLVFSNICELQNGR